MNTEKTPQSDKFDNELAEDQKRRDASWTQKTGKILKGLGLSAALLSSTSVDAKDGADNHPEDMDNVKHRIEAEDMRSETTEPDNETMSFDKARTLYDAEKTTLNLAGNFESDQAHFSNPEIVTEKLTKTFESLSPLEVQQILDKRKAVTIRVESDFRPTSNPEWEGKNSNLSLARAHALINAIKKFVSSYGFDNLDISDDQKQQLRDIFSNAHITMPYGPDTELGVQPKEKVLAELDISADNFDRLSKKEQQDILEPYRKAEISIEDSYERFLETMKQYNDIHLGIDVSASMDIADLERMYAQFEGHNVPLSSLHTYSDEVHSQIMKKGYLHKDDILSKKIIEALGTGSDDENVGLSMNQVFDAVVAQMDEASERKQAIVMATDERIPMTPMGYKNLLKKLSEKNVDGYFLFTHDDGAQEFVNVRDIGPLAALKGFDIDDMEARSKFYIHPGAYAKSGDRTIKQSGENAVTIARAEQILASSE